MVKTTNKYLIAFSLQQLAIIRKKNRTFALEIIWDANAVRG